MFSSRVDLPAPKKPESKVTGSRVSFIALTMMCEIVWARMKNKTYGSAKRKKFQLVVTAKVLHEEVLKTSEIV